MVLRWPPQASRAARPRAWLPRWHEVQAPVARRRRARDQGLGASARLGVVTAGG